MAARAGLTRLDGPGRLAGVDLARGLAVIGMLAAHLIALPTLAWTDAATWPGIAGGRSSILFATLAGASIGLATGGARPVAGEERGLARRRLAMRAALIWVLGVALILTGVPVYVILPAYAILFLLAIPAIGLSAGTVLWLAAALAVVMPFVQVVLDGLPWWRTSMGGALALMIGWHYPFPVWIAFVLAGLGIARLGLGRARVQWGMLAAGVALAVAGYGFDALRGREAAAVPGAEPQYWARLWTAEEHSSGLLEVVGSGGFALAVLGLCLLVCRAALVSGILLPVRAVGSMPLTAYTGQLLVWALVAAVLLGDPGDLRGFRGLEPFWPFTLVTLAGCTVWALFVGRGPLEDVVHRIARRVGPRRAR